MSVKMTLLKDVLAKTSIDPKVARRKLRAAFPDHDKGTTWSFSPVILKKVRTLLGITKAPAKTPRKQKSKTATTVAKVAAVVNETPTPSPV